MQLIFSHFLHFIRRSGLFFAQFRQKKVDKVRQNEIKPLLLQRFMAP